MNIFRDAGKAVSSKISRPSHKNFLCSTFELEPIFARKKICICGSFMSAKTNWAHKSQISKLQKGLDPQIATFAEALQI
jgi:hypothetical protein